MDRYGVFAIAVSALFACRSAPQNTTQAAASASASPRVAAPLASVAPAPPPSASALASATPASRGTRLVLLGTKGGPRVGPPGTARNPSTLILIDGIPHVVDCGYGTSTQLVGAGVALNSVRHVFITHHHSDHVLELGPLVYNGWVTGLRTRVDIHGPPGTAKQVADFFASMKLDIDTRIADEGRPDPRRLVVATDFAEPGLVFSNEAVKVTALRVPHPPIVQAYAYRFDTRDASIVISGDTAYSPALADFAKGADVLVHEVMHPVGIETILKRVPNPVELRKHLLASHTVPEDVGKVAAKAGVKTLVLHHFVPGDDPKMPDEAWTEGVKKHFDGRIVVGKDLLEVALAK